MLHVKYICSVHMYIGNWRKLYGHNMYIASGKIYRNLTVFVSVFIDNRNSQQLSQLLPQNSAASEQPEVQLDTSQQQQESRSRGAAVLTDEQRLLRRLMRNYDSNTRPVYNASYPVVVRLGITLNQIFDLVCT